MNSSLPFHSFTSKLHQYNYRVTDTKKVKHNFYLSYLFFTVLSVLLLGNMVTAQPYHDFHNADSANPILNATPKPQNINGLQFFDVDDDRDKDCYLMSDQRMLLYRNTGTVTHPEYQLSDSTGFEDVTLPTSPYTQHFCFFDLDGDGDEDFFIEGYSVYQNHGGGYSFIQAFINDGSPMKPHFTVSSANPVDFLNNASNLSFYNFTFQDIDGDGDKDFYYAASTVDFGYISNVYLNTSMTGYASFTLYPGYGAASGSNYRSFYDFSGDGLPDCLLNNGNDQTYYRVNEGTLSAPYYNLFNVPQPGPAFGGVAANEIVDLNNDGAVEIFNLKGNYATLVPVPVIVKATVSVHGKKTTRLTSANQVNGYEYQWEYNGSKITHYNKPFIDAFKKGNYVLFITDSLGTGVSLPCNITTDTIRTTNTLQKIVENNKLTPQTFSVTVYPNPFSQTIYLRLTSGNMTMQKTIRITDMAGKIVLLQTTSSSSLQIGGTLSKGLYNLEIWQKNKLSYHTVIMKQ